MSEFTYGALPDKPDHRDWPVARIARVAEQTQDFIPEWLPPVKNQGYIGSCVAHALSTIREIQEHRETGSYKRLSAGFIYGNRNEEDHQGEGMFTRQALQNMVEDGVCLDALMPINSYYKLVRERITRDMRDNAMPRKITAYARARDKAESMSAIKELGGVVIVIPVHKNFNKGGVNGVIEKPLSHELIENPGYHAIAGYAYESISTGRTYYGGQNSWGTVWGDNGRFTLSEDYPIMSIYTATDAPTPEADYYIKLWLDKYDLLHMNTGDMVKLDVAPQLLQGSNGVYRTMIGLRHVFEQLGHKVIYDSKERAILISK